MTLKSKSETVISVDIGSTFTKGAVFRITKDKPALLDRANTPSTPDDLAEGVGRVLRKLAGNNSGEIREIAAEIPVYFSSSAKGGLKIAAVGLVPELTVEASKITAHSAGARISGVFSFKLTESDIAKIVETAPDIVLLAGGTDGGNETMIIHNAEAIAASSYCGTIVFAGNRNALDRVSRIFSGGKFLFAENLMPELGRFNPEAARGLIRKVFLDEIVKGKGLDRIVDAVGKNPKPTPLGVYELVGSISSVDKGWSDFSLIDLGGATTDFYSNALNPHDNSTVDKGLIEPKVKRTVEGDLGMRVSAASLMEFHRNLILADASKRNIGSEFLESYVRKISLCPEHLPEGEAEAEADFVLAKTCVAQSMARHAGRIREVYTPTGKVSVRNGKDLRNVKRIIGTGGYLSACVAAEIYEQGGIGLLADAEERMLLPLEASFYRDFNYIIPMLGCIVSDYPEESVEIALSNLKKLE